MFEFLKQSGTYEVALFMCGVFTYKILSMMLLRGYNYLLVREVVRFCLKMSMALIYENAELNQTKYKRLKGVGYTEEELRDIKLRDQYFIQSWAKESFGIIRKHCPKGYEKTVDYDNLIQAFMEHEDIKESDESDQKKS